MRWLILIMLRLVLVHVPGGDELELNPHEVSSIREPKDVQEHFQRDVHCIIVMTMESSLGRSKIAARSK